MQDKTWSFVDKSDWGIGPWQNEPDKVQWTDKATGLPCLAVRNSAMGHWCGYVGVSQGHPCFNVGYDDVAADVHGGLTFSDLCDDNEHGVCHVVEPDEKVWWLGFDCAHSGDKSPASDALLARHGFGSLPDSRYWTLTEVQAECASLATQIKEQQSA